MQLRWGPVVTAALAASALAGAALGAVSAAATTSPVAPGRTAAACASAEVSAPRDPANPLALASPPGADPLHGAHFFIDGPRHGAVAQVIESLLGLSNAAYTDADTWASFQQAVTQRLGSVSASVAHQVEEYLKIGSQEETQSVSLFAEGGGYRGIYGQVMKLLCGSMAADPAPLTVPVFTTYFAHPAPGSCPSVAALRRWWPTFRADVRAMAVAIGHRRAVILSEIDSIGTSGCLHGEALQLWLRELSYEVGAFSRLPHAVVYQEAGSEDETPAPRVAQLLVDIGVNRIRGFFSNDTHLNWSSSEVSWGDRVAAAVRQLYARRHPAIAYLPHFVVNTAQNGRGPKRNPHPRTQGSEALCNPPGRGLGRLPTADTSPTFDGQTFSLLDAFLWTGVPGRSHGTTCYPGAKPGGVFDPRFALELAENANQQLGPGYPSRPY